MQKKPFRILTALLLCAAVCLPGMTAAGYQVSDWATEDVDRAVRCALVSETLLEAGAEAAVTRGDFAAISVNLYQALSGEDVEAALSGAAASPFTDCDAWAVTAAARAKLVNGFDDGTFRPAASIRRQDLCMMLGNTLSAAGVLLWQPDSEAILAAFPDGGEVMDYARGAVALMVELGVVKGTDNDGVVTLDPFGETTVEQAVAMAIRANRIAARLLPSPGNGYVEELGASRNLHTLWQMEEARDELVYPQTSEEKYTLVFGPDRSKWPQRWNSVVEGYASSEEAAANMTVITVPVWRLGNNGSKVSGTMSLTVNAKIAYIYEAVFEEIYNGAEKFPILYAGSYSYREGEHSRGTAVDINADANMECYRDANGELTSVTAGTHWTPGEDPYSIAADSDVVRAFEKYGFFWAGRGWPKSDGSTKYDYMHFSYFGG